MRESQSQNILAKNSYNSNNVKMDIDEDQKLEYEEELQLENSSFNNRRNMKVKLGLTLLDKD